MSNCFGEFLLLPHQRSYPSLAHSVVSHSVTQCCVVCCVTQCCVVTPEKLSLLVLPCHTDIFMLPRRIREGKYKHKSREYSNWSLWAPSLAPFWNWPFFPFCSSTDGGKEKKEKNIAENIMLIKSFKKGNENNSHDDDCDDDDDDGLPAYSHLADYPAMSFIFVRWHSRKWEPPIGGGLLQLAFLRP